MLFTDKPARRIFQVFLVIKQNELVLPFLCRQSFVEIARRWVGSSPTLTDVKVIGLAFHINGGLNSVQLALRGFNGLPNLLNGPGEQRSETAASIRPEIHLWPGILVTDVLEYFLELLTVNVLFGSQ